MRENAQPRRRRWQALLVAGAVTIGLTVSRAEAALIPSVSEELRGRPLPSFESQTLDGHPFSSRELLGKPVIVNFFASWCPVCSMELKDLQTLQPELRQRGVSVIEVLVDPVETPDTVDEARRQLAGHPLPFPVVMMVPPLRDVFGYEGFPATYFIHADGTFSTTLFGYQPIEELRQVAAEIAGATAPPPSAVPGGGVGRHPPWEKRPLLALVPAPWAQWHPLLVHFPIALLVLEAVFVCALLMRPNEHVAQFSTWLLAAAVVSLVPTIVTGIRDAGADLGPESPFWNGLHDRLTHLFRLESSVSLHVLFGLAVTFIAVGRLTWRAWAGDRILRGGQRMAYALVTLLGLWVLFGGGQVGGGISHR
jgi:thiol-disulfide isomerase/thioredoxin